MARTPSLHALSRGRRALAGAAVGLLVFLVLWGLRRTAWVEDLELGLIDARTRHFAGDREPDPRILLVQVHEEDVAAVARKLPEKWPWRLDINAALFQVMADAGAEAVMLDVYHLDRGAGPDDVPNPEDLDEAALQQRRGEALSADAYAGALKSLKNVALAFELSDAPEYEVSARVEAAHPRLLPPGFDPPADGRAYRGANWPVRRVIEGAALLGFANVEPGVDGVVRRASVLGRAGEKSVLSLPLATAALVTDAPPRLEDDVLILGDARQRLMPARDILVSFRSGGRGSYPRLAPARIFNWLLATQRGEPLPEEARTALAGKIVVWGVNLAGQEDVVACPIDGALHGPEFQATVLDNLLHGDGRVRAEPLANTLLLLCVALLLGVLGGWSRRGYVSHVAAAAALVLVVCLAFLLFRGGTSIDMLTPAAGVVLSWAGTLVLRLLTEGRRNRWLEGTFGRYMAPSIIAALKEDPSLLELGGRERELTILFSDVEGFTKLCEPLEAAEVVALLNRYLTAHCAAVMAEGGVVDKFEGDAVMAFFGDPVPTPDHAVRACRAALAVIERLPDLQPFWEQLGLSGFRIRVGLNSGDAVVGNMGSSQRFDYTCMGDSVNLASRLEGANKAFGTTILLGSRTYEEARGHVVAKALAEVVVVGRKQPEPVYELLSMRASAAPELVEHVQAFERARAAALAGDVDAARAQLRDAERLRPGDRSVAWLDGILEGMASGAEPTPWSGVVTLTGK